jgi:hypothetical protein
LTEYIIYAKITPFLEDCFYLEYDKSAIFGAIGFGGLITSYRVLGILKKPFSTCVTDYYFEFKN